MNTSFISSDPGDLATQTLVPYQPQAQARYSLDMVARLTNVSRHHIVLYCKHGFVVPLTDPEESGWFFDAETIRAICRIEQLRDAYGTNLAGTRLMLTLLNEVEQLRRELRYLREL